ncbi:hypothetical protein [Streptomyces halstedii]|uniref:hypothetical protein n=1 Tax=Streptomyces halstedii TaxID=1944 RepID=UPI00386844F4
MNLRDTLDYLARLVQQDADRTKAEAHGESPEQLLAAAENRARLAHEARRAKAAQLDNVKRALIDTGAIDESDPYGHADLPDVIRQAMADRDPAYALAEQERARQAEYALTAEIRHAERTEQRAEQAEAERDELHAALGLAPGQLHSAALSAIRGRAANCRELIARAKAAEVDAERFKADHLAACRTIADMHEAATGRPGKGPVRGVVEDVADVRARAEEAERRARHWQRAAQEAAARTKGIMRDRDRAAAAREQAQQDAKDAKERARVAMVAAHGLRLQTPDRAQRALARIRDARDTSIVWTELGMYYGMTPEQAGRRARDWRKAAETIAERHAQRAETAPALGAPEG